MRQLLRFRVLGPLALTIAAAEVGGRLLSPRQASIEPAEIDLRTYFSEPEIRRGKRFARPQMALALARAAIQLTVLAAVVWRPPRVLHPRRLSPPASGAATAAELALALTIAQLPLAAVARRRALTVGLITQSWRAWGVDLAKSTAIQSGLASGAGGAIVGLMRRYPRAWWLPAGAGSVLVGAALAALAPVVLDPIFNDFTPLPDGVTRTDVLALASAAGVHVGEVYSVDASRRTTAANAYVTGLGPTKRVVIFDTLLDRYSRDELRVVVAHELAHVRNRDVARSILYLGIASPVAALATQRLSVILSPERGSGGALPALALAAAVAGIPSAVVGNRLSRAVERRADRYSLELSGSPEAFVSFERAVALQNLADLEPPRWVRGLLATHPSTAERIGAAVAYAGTMTG